MHLLPLKGKNEFCEIWSIIGAIVDDTEVERRRQMFHFNPPAALKKKALCCPSSLTWRRCGKLNLVSRGECTSYCTVFNCLPKYL